MMFDYTSFGLAVCLVAISGAISYSEKTWIAGRVDLGFANHAGMWSDVFLMAPAVGLIAPFLKGKWVLLTIAGGSSLGATLFVHSLWVRHFRSVDITCHMIPRHSAGRWFSDLSGAGWMHVITMTYLLTIVFGYVCAPVPPTVVITTSTLLSVHLYLSCMQPGWYCTGDLWNSANTVPPTVAAVIVWLVASFKLGLA